MVGSFTLSSRINSNNCGFVVRASPGPAVKFWVGWQFPTIKIYIYLEKATTFCEISTINLSYVVPFKSTVEISKKYFAVSGYINLIYIFYHLSTSQMRIFVREANAQCTVDDGTTEGAKKP